MGGRTWVVLNSNRVVKDIISKNCVSTGDRPDFPIAGSLVSSNKRTVLRKTKNWKEGRKLMHHLLSGTALKTYSCVQEAESTTLLHNYLDQPDQWHKHNYNYSYSIVHRIVFGKRTRQTQEQLDDIRRITVEFIQSINSSVFDFFPSLGIFQPFRSFWSSMGADHYEVFRAWWDPVMQDMADGVAPASFTREVILHSKGKYATDNDEAMYLATSIVAAGSDNVRMAHNVFMMAAVCNPEVVANARTKIDSVCGCGANRLPDLGDMESLPYISAILKECLRWRPVVPLIPQHHSTKEIHFDGYFFPAGTDFVINSLAVCEEVDDPADFKPERWEDREMNITDGLWQFGGGRRASSYFVSIVGAYKAAAKNLEIIVSNIEPISA
ncbi:MAG: hypothetical protein L6R39_001151 [Caloplaca ligustica]|nr:MAG: hypothetical protein L6R39_001151 [Caloplaca ligustica]